MAAALPATGLAPTQRLLRGLDGLIGFLASACLSVMIAVVSANVVARYLLNSSLTWSEEIALWLFVYIIFLGMPLALSQGMHLSLSALEDRLSGRARMVLLLAVDAIVGYVTIAMLFGGLDIMRMIGGVSPAIELPAWLRYVMIAPCCAASLVYVALRPGRGLRWSLGAIALAVIAYVALHQWQMLAVRGISPSLVAGIAFLGALALGVPVAFAMLFGVFLARSFGAPLPDAAVVQQVVTGASKFILLAIPFFLTAGMLMNVGGLTTRLIDFAASLVGHLRGGLGQVTVATSLMFSGISGSSISEAAIGSKLLVPELVRNGYRPATACAVVAAASVLPNIIPPSIALLIMAAAVNLSVGDLWMAGILPGILLGLCLMVMVWARAGGAGRMTLPPRAPLARVARTGMGALPVLVLVAIILGGIRFGVVTPTESGVLAVLYSLFLGLAVYRLYTPATAWAQLNRCAVEAALVGLMIGAAAPFAFLLVAERVPQAVAALVDSWTDSRLMVLLLVNLVLLVAGMILDIGAAILILTPLMLPMAVKFGIDPIHFGIIVAVNLMLGGLTPPVGMLVYVTSSVTGTPAHQVFRAIGPFLAAMLAGLALISLVPWLSLAFVR